VIETEQGVGFGARSHIVNRQPDLANPEDQRADRVCAPYGWPWRFIVSYRRQPKFLQQRPVLSFVRVQQC
jgi:hypothetical protein